MLAWFQKIMPREERFFDMFERHVQCLIGGSQALRSMLDVVNADRCLTGSEASLIAQALRQWEIALYEISDTTIPSHRLPLPKVSEIHLA